MLRWSQESFGLQGARALSGLRDRLPAAGIDPLDTLEQAVFNGKNRPIDAQATARGLVASARRGRVRALFSRLMSRL